MAEVERSMEVTPNLRRKQAWLCLGVFVFLGLGLAAPNWFLTLGAVLAATAVALYAATTQPEPPEEEHHH